MKFLIVLSAVLAVALAKPGIIAAPGVLGLGAIAVAPEATLARDAVVNHAQIAVARTQGAIAAAQGTAAAIDAQAYNLRDAVVNAAQVNIARAQGAAAALDGLASAGVPVVAAAPTIGLGLPIDAHIAARIHSGLLVL